MRRFSGKRVFITGGAGGIGRALCHRFAAEGAEVLVSDLDPGRTEETAQHVGGTSAVCDITSSEEVERTFREVGPVNVLINAAGISVVRSFLETDEALWDATLRVNLKGAFLCCRAALPGLLERGGNIVNLGSQSGKQGNAQYAAYCASKFGLIGLTQSLAMELADTGVRVNAVCPGVVWTSLWKDMAPDYARKRGIPAEEVPAYLASRIPLGRLCTPEDVAGVAAFVASDDAAYMTGQAVNVTGGRIM